MNRVSFRSLWPRPFRREPPASKDQPDRSAAPAAPLALSPPAGEGDPLAQPPVDPVPRPPLPITGVALLLLVVVPVLVLLRDPRPRARGLEQLMEAASLLQSFPAAPDRPVPELWRQRFGMPLAERLWRRQGRSWLQFWGPHADGAPYLALPAATLPLPPGRPLPANALRVGDLLVMAPDPLSRQVLADRLLPQQRPARGLRRRCLERLERDQAVLWNPTALGVIAGPMASLLQGFQEGCLSLRLDPAGVAWQGEAAAGRAAPEAATLPSATPDPGAGGAPLPADLLLEMQGPDLDALLQGLLSRELIRGPLTSRYGLDAKRLELLRRSPFRLRLRPQPRGPFQASLELQISVGPDRRPWLPVLERIAQSLRQESYRDLGPMVSEGTFQAPGSTGASAGSALPSPGPGSPAPDAAAPPPPPASGGAPAVPSLLPAPGGSGAAGATWVREDGVVVGGWRWLGPGVGPQQLLLFLGPVPSLPLPLRAEGASAAGLWLRVRPAALDQLSLLPPEVPALVRRSAELWMQAGEKGAGTAGVTPLQGGLQMGR